MKRHSLDVLCSVLFESADWLSVNPARSWITIQQRFENEGDSYLTITLPAMHDALMKCVDDGRWSPSRLWKESTGGPVFLREFLGLVFDFGDSNRTLKCNDPKAVLALRCLRQVLLLFGKMRALPSASRIEKSIQGFFNVESELRDLRKQISSNCDKDFDLAVGVLFSDVLFRSQRDLESSQFRHGPGATADRFFGIPKYSALETQWTSRLDAAFDFSSVGFRNRSEFLAIFPDGHYAPLSPANEPPMRIVLVPKTMKTPRIIAMEPTVNQWVQQGILGLLDNNIQRSSYARTLSWRDQSRNRDLARQGSLDRSNATLDLSEASDRLHVSVVNRMLKNYPLLRKSVMACRSSTADLSGRKIRLEKFAPMGSALCFAFESMAFFAICSLSVARADCGLNDLTARHIINASRKISVYGDDIIVPRHRALQVVADLEAFGLKVNRRKSFWNGNFRESCGADYFLGHDVSVCRIREEVSYNPKDLELFASTVELQNRLFEKGFFSSAEFLAEKLKKSGLSTVLPGDRAGLWLWDHVADMPTTWNPRLQRGEYSTLARVFNTGEGAVRDEDRLFHWYVSLSETPSERVVSSLVRRPQLVRLRKSNLAS